MHEPQLCIKLCGDRYTHSSQLRQCGQHATGSPIGLPVAIYWCYAEVATVTVWLSQTTVIPSMDRPILKIGVRMSEQYPCLCCGYQTLPQQPPGTWEICPVCFWEDAPRDWEWRSNAISLRQAQRNFLRLGACEPEWIDDVRHPTPSEQRPLGWKAMDEQESELKAVLIAQITTAFSKVLREDGVSLHQARIIDGYGSAEAEAQARLLDTDSHWWEVPDAWIAEFYEILNFVDPKGFRYYIPAYMIWVLKNYHNTQSNSVDSTLYSFFTYNSSKDWRQQYFDLLDEAQSKAICHFLRHMVWLGDEFVDAKIAQQALKQYWGQFCDSAYAF